MKKKKTHPDQHSVQNPIKWRRSKKTKCSTREREQGQNGEKEKMNGIA